MSDVEKAEQTLRDLEQKRLRLVESRAADADQRRAVAFKAHAGGDKGARQALDKLADAAARFESELRSVEDAIAEAQDRLQQARAAAARERDKANAIELKQALKEFCEMGTELDAALSDVVASAAEMRAALDRMHALSAPAPNDLQFMTLGALAVHTALMALPFRDVARHLAPTERKSFNGLIAEWRRMVERVIAERLGEAEQTTNEAA